MMGVSSHVSVPTYLHYLVWVKTILDVNIRHQCRLFAIKKNLTHTNVLINYAVFVHYGLFMIIKLGVGLLRCCNTIPLRKAKTLWSFGLSECNRVKIMSSNTNVSTGSVCKKSERTELRY